MHLSFFQEISQRHYHEGANEAASILPLLDSCLKNGSQKTSLLHGMGDLIYIPPCEPLPGGTIYAHLSDWDGIGPVNRFFLLNLLSSFLR